MLRSKWKKFAQCQFLCKPLTSIPTVSQMCLISPEMACKLKISSPQIFHQRNDSEAINVPPHHRYTTHQHQNTHTQPLAKQTARVRELGILQKKIKYKSCHDIEDTCMSLTSVWIEFWHQKKMLFKRNEWIPFFSLLQFLRTSIMNSVKFFGEKKPQCRFTKWNIQIEPAAVLLQWSINERKSNGTGKRDNASRRFDMKPA